METTRRRARTTALVVGACVALVACSGGSPSTAATTTTTTTAVEATAATTPLPPLSDARLTRVLPSATSPDIGAPDGASLAALDPSVRANGRLLVFLPGTGGMPRCCQLLLEVAATMGFAAIGLTYPNTPSVDARCGNDRGCYGPVRRNVFDGTEQNAQRPVTPKNSIEFRLRAMLSYLARTQPAGPWATFLGRTGVEWERVVVAGHSQGGGEAAYIGTVKRTAGVVMLSADVDSTNTKPPLPASYVASRRLTPLDRYVGFLHTADPFAEKITAVWSALGLGRFGPLTSVDGRRAPYDGSHQLTTSAGVPRVIALPEHDSTAVDIETPRCSDGTPQFAPVWRDLMQVAAGLPRIPSPPVC